MKMIIMQGWSGSGKSTLAKSFGLPIVSTDNYFMDEDQYKFDFNLLGVYHTLNVLETERLMSKGYSVCVDNTNLQNWQIAPYVHLADKYKFEIEIAVATGNFKNTHNVPDEVVEQMKAKREELNLDIARTIPVTLKKNFMIYHKNVYHHISQINFFDWEERVKIAQRLKVCDFDENLFDLIPDKTA